MAKKNSTDATTTTGTAAPTLNDYLAARDRAIKLNAEVAQHRKDLSAIERRIERKSAEASAAEDEAIALAKTLELPVS